MEIRRKEKNNSKEENKESRANKVIFIIMIILISIPCLLFLTAFIGFLIRAVTSGIN